MLIGDSFVHGGCVNRPNDIASVLRSLTNKSAINLGFADADAFCEEITNAYQAKINIDKHLVLKRYEIRRKNMNLLMLKSMDFFVNLFKSNNLYIKLLRNFGLSRVNKTQFLKKFFINHASGKNKI